MSLKNLPFLSKISDFTKQSLVCATLIPFLLHGQPSIPKFNSFQPYSASFSPKQNDPLSNAQANSIINADPVAVQNRKILLQAGMLPGPVPVEEKGSKIELAQQEQEMKESQTLNKSDFQNNFNQFLQLNPNDFSISKAVYLSESAFYDSDSRPSWEQFEMSIQQGVRLVRQILKKEGLSDNNEISIHYAIQKLFTQDNEYYDSTNKRQYVIPRLRYDFEDYMGNNDWTKMFVMKLLHTGMGQCHSMPLTYLCLAEQFKIKAYLSLAPNHSFVQYFDSQKQRYNFETTNGNIVTQTWIMQSTYVNATALKKGTYLDTLSNRKLYAQCLGDFLLTYLMKVRAYDNFADELINKILEIDPQNITALMEISNRDYAIFQHDLKAFGNPPAGEYSKYPSLNAARSRLQASELKVAATGFQEMPQQAYQQWLLSLELEKRREENKRGQERMKQEIKRLEKFSNKILLNKKD